MAWPSLVSALPTVPSGTPLGPVFGAAVRIDNVAIYPITLLAQDDIGPVVTLEEALARGQAEVREVGAGAQPTRTAPVRRIQRQRQQGEANIPNIEPLQRMNDPQVQTNLGAGGGPTVNTLVIENKGKVPLFVLAGTVVKGGNQDRQIGQDFIVDAGKTVAVDAFCVEHGRWTGERNGKGTAGKFEAVAMLATKKVRAAGQHAKNQSEVWSKVSDANKAHAKSAASGTLMATFDDRELAAKADALSKRISEQLAAASPSGQLVGFAYAVDGQIQGARWFAHRRLFAMYEAKLVRSAAIEALTAVAEARAAGKAAFGGADPAPQAVEHFIAEVEAQAVKETRATAGQNDNEYKESAKAYGAKTRMKGASGKAVSFDYMTK
jgi:hypothetical protein